MAAPKRWYQLSILQLLVATSVVAVFIVKNASTSIVEPASLASPYSFSIDLGDTPLVLGTIRSGWPLPYWHAYGTVNAGQVVLAADPKVRIGVLVADVALCAVVVVVATAVVARFRRRSSL